jgi:hypothetical protein
MFIEEKTKEKKVDNFTGDSFSESNFSESNFSENIFPLVSKLTNFPSEIVKIVLNFAIITARQQYLEKYDEANKIYKSSCQCYDESLAKYIGVEEYKKLPSSYTPPKCDRCNTYVRWTDSFHLAFCRHCEKSSMFVTLENKYEKKGQSMNFEACKNCSKIVFCPQGKSDSDICLADMHCSLCKDSVCYHSMHSVFGNYESCICKDCGEVFLLMKANFLRAKPGKV